MGSLHKFLLAIFLLFAALVEETRADAMVSGTVFCDQCKDGQRSLFDYPLYGVKVVVSCGDSNGQVTMWKEETTNWFGSYAVRFEGSPDLSGCYAQVSGSGQDSTSCGAVAGPARQLRLMFKMFDMEIYTSDFLLSQPATPMSFCPKPANPLPKPVAPPSPKPVAPPSPKPVTPPTPPIVRSPPTPTPFWDPSACPYQSWTMPEHKCYWRMVQPDTKVAVAFGLIAARRYGTDMTLWEGLQGRGDVYRTLLREATTALLNSYMTLQFSYPPLFVIGNMNSALMGSPRHALLMALRFKRANNGYGRVTCNFTPCK